MQESTLLGICTANINDALGQDNSSLSKERAENLDRYLGELHGNEIDGRSQAVTVEVAEQVDSILPSLVETFATAEQSIVFSPAKPGLEQQAEQETDYVNHVFYKKNNGFLILYNACKDALLAKNGIVKIYWDDATKVTTHEYHGLTQQQAALLLQDKELSLIESTTEIVDIQAQTDGIHFLPGPSMQLEVYNLKVKRTRKGGCVVIENVLPEEFVISRGTKSIYPRDADFVAHRPVLKASDLIAMGFDREEVYRAAHMTALIGEDEKSARDYLDDDSFENLDTADKSMRDVQVDECYLRVDFDGDGIAELRKVTIFGNKVQSNEPIDVIPFACISTNLIPHKFYGLCPADQTKHYQFIKTTILRQLLDNMYFMNNRRLGVSERVNIEDVLTNRTGGIIRVEDGAVPGNEIFPLPVQPLGTEAFSLFSSMDDLISARTGMNDNAMGLNQGIVGDTAHGVERIMTAAEMRLKLLVRVAAEGVKDIFWHIRSLLKKYQDFEEFIKLRGQWNAVNPADWADEFEIDIQVGFGSGEKLRQTNILLQILELQKQMYESGFSETLVSQSNIYNTFRKLLKANNLPIEGHFVDPNSQEGQQAAQQKAQAAQQAKQEEMQNDPNLQIVNATIQIENLKRQVDQMKEQLDYKKHIDDLNFRLKELDQKFLTDMTKIEAQYNKNVPGSAI